MSDKIIITEPQTSEEFEAYLLVRYNVLRKPWNQPHGSERDKDDPQSVHFMAQNDKKEILGVCRLQFNSPSEAQLRFMGVVETTQGSGIGRKLIRAAEERAKKEGASTMILHAREIAVDFYKKCGYTVREKSYLMWNEIQHYLMERELNK